MSGVVILRTVSAAQSLGDAVKLHEDADKLREQGRYAEAEPLYKRALAIYEQAALEYEQEANKYKTESKLVQKILAVTLNNLAELYIAHACYADADALLEQSLAILEQALGTTY